MKKEIKPNLMNYHEILDWIINKFHDLKDAALGSFIYFLYGHFYQRRDLYKGLIAFFIGTVFALYLSPLFQSWTGWSINVVSFLTGLLGMRLTEAIVNQDYKTLIKSKLNQN